MAVAYEQSRFERELLLVLLLSVLANEREGTRVSASRNLLVNRHVGHHHHDRIQEQGQGQELLKSEQRRSGPQASRLLRESKTQQASKQPRRCEQESYVSGWIAPTT